MKILFIIPGSGDSFYCGNCFRDNLHATALRKAGHEVIIMPLYLPLTHKSIQANTPIFFSAVTYYIAQKFFARRRIPKWLERLTGSRAALRIASSMSGTTSAEGMEAMTLSMITGAITDKAFHNQVQPLIEWIRNHDTPDVIHLSTTLLLGVAKAIHKEMNIPTVCSLQDEEVWIDTLNTRDARAAWSAIAQNITCISAFTASSEFYKATAIRRFPHIRHIEVIYPGIDHSKYACADVPAHPTIGFFYRMNRDNGLHILAEAFAKLKRNNTIPNLKLKIGGGYSGADRRFLRKIRRTLAPFMSDVEICSHYSVGSHASFYASVSVVCVPLTFDEAVGLYVCEAFACGRPAVEPATGSFPEIVSDAGILYHPNTPEALSQALEIIFTTNALYTASTRKANELATIRYSDKVAAERLTKLYATLVDNGEFRMES
ncbi:MAG: glycosyltransferase family 4 protein [Cytophagaceae bacterium]|jgi:glycosyltransferase involved in cell wall biosynthesis|nr:glycosyltransferase family 4 protein [Cytophagaceae bacterium]